MNVMISANILFQVEGLIDEKDMRIKVSREELEELCKDLFDKVVLPAQRALESSGLTIELIEQVWFKCIINIIHFVINLILF